MCERTISNVLRQKWCQSESSLLHSLIHSYRYVATRCCGDRFGFVRQGWAPEEELHPLAGATDDAQPWGMLHPDTCDSTSGVGGRLHPLPLDQPRSCRRVRHSITILGSIWDSAQRSWSYINKASIIIIESITSYLCNVTVAQTGVRIGWELRPKLHNLLLVTPDVETNSPLSTLHSTVRLTRILLSLSNKKSSILSQKG